jgi:uncharacterized protein YkwD
MLNGGISNIGVMNLNATSGTPTIRMGSNTPMTRNEFMEWTSQKGVRHIQIDGRIYPASIFFNWASGQLFSYGELNEGILHVELRLVESNGLNNLPALNNADANENSPDGSGCPVLAIFDGSTPIMLTDDELTSLIESAQHQTPMDTRRNMTLSRKRLTETELAAWINDYKEMGGATAFELSVVLEINRVREQHGLSLLALDPVLMMSARLKTHEFADLQYFNHISPIHGTPTAAARMLGFEGRSVSETIAQSGSNGTPVFRTTAERIVGGMLASTSGHKEILLNPHTASVGFGAFFSPNSTGRTGNMTHMFYFATQFGFSN